MVRGSLPALTDQIMMVRNTMTYDSMTRAILHGKRSVMNDRLSVNMILLFFAAKILNGEEQKKDTQASLLGCTRWKMFIINSMCDYSIPSQSLASSFASSQNWLYSFHSSLCSS